MSETTELLKSLKISDIGSAEKERLIEIRKILEGVHLEGSNRILSGVRAFCEYRLKNYDSAFELSKDIDPNFFLCPEGEAYFPYYCKRLLENRDTEKLETLVNALPSTYFTFDYRRMYPFIREPISEVDFPRVLFNAIPKSASVFLNTILADSLQALACSVPLNQFPDSEADETFLSRFKAKKRTFFYGHLKATPSNVTTFNKHFDKIILHVRDPRQTIVSWLNFIEKETATSGPYLYLVPDDFSERSPAEKRSLALTDHYPRFLDWLTSWKSVSKRFGSKLLVLRYEDFVESPRKYFSELIDFLDIEDTVDRILDLNKMLKEHSMHAAQLHFREGSTDSWSRHLSDSEKDTLKNITPLDLLSFYGWNQNL